MRSLRARSVLASATAILLALVVLGAGVDVLVSRHLHRSLDRTLRVRAVEIAQLSASAPALLTTPGALDSPLGGTQLVVEVVDRHGRVVARSLSLGGRVLPRDLARRAVADEQSRYLVRDEVRLFVAPLADVGGPAAGGAVIVGASTDDIDGTLSSLHAFLLLSALLAAVVGGVGVALLLHRALRPLGQLADAAAEIDRTGDARRRLPEPRTADEVGRLAATLNAMLASLERARDAERRFVADASHELRTPLTALRGNVAHLARHGATPELVEDLARDAERLARLADDLLALSREEAAAPPEEDVRVDELARDAAAEDVDVVAPEPLVVRGDAAALERALANLVENARRHGRGRVTITAERRDSRAVLTVRDEGEGVSAADAEAAFSRFWRGEAGGSGLGLAIVRATAERHGGRAFADRAAFAIELPVSQSGLRVRG